MIIRCFKAFFSISRNHKKWQKIVNEWSPSTCLSKCIFIFENPQIKGEELNAEFFFLNYTVYEWSIKAWKGETKMKNTKKSKSRRTNEYIWERHTFLYGSRDTSQILATLRVFHQSHTSIKFSQPWFYFSSTRLIFMGFFIKILLFF